MRSRLPSKVPVVVLPPKRRRITPCLCLRDLSSMAIPMPEIYRIHLRNSPTWASSFHRTVSNPALPMTRSLRRYMQMIQGMVLIRCIRIILIIGASGDFDSKCVIGGVSFRRMSWVRKSRLSLERLIFCPIQKMGKDYFGRMRIFPMPTFDPKAKSGMKVKMAMYQTAPRQSPHGFTCDRAMAWVCLIVKRLSVHRSMTIRGYAGRRPDHTHNATF